MPRYFLHLRDSTEEVLDPDGLEISFDEVPAKALWSARDCMAGDVKDGRLDLRFRIDVEDENNIIVHTLPFASALEVLWPA